MLDNEMIGALLVAVGVGCVPGTGMCLTYLNVKMLPGLLVSFLIAFAVSLTFAFWPYQKGAILSAIVVGIILPSLVSLIYFRLKMPRDFASGLRRRKLNARGKVKRWTEAPPEERLAVGSSRWHSVVLRTGWDFSSL